MLEYLNFFNKIITELLAVDMKIDEKDKTLILLSSLSEIYDHIVTTILYEKKTLILKEVTTTLLSIKKRPNQNEQKHLGLVVMGKKGKRGRKKKLGVHRRLVIFISRKAIGIRIASIDKSG